MALIYCPECKKQISDKAEACPHCGLPGTYFSLGQDISLAPDKQADKPDTDYKTLRNMLIAFEKDYAEVFAVQRYIASSSARAFYQSYSH